MSSYKHNAKDSKVMAHQAVRMVGRGLDMTMPADSLKWEDMAESLIRHWELENWNYQLMVELEPDLLVFAREELIIYVHSFVLENQ